MRNLGVQITWENIGDPVHKGEKIAPWIKEIVLGVAAEDRSWAYCETPGVPAAREFLAERRNAMGGAKISPHDILFFNGLGDSMGKLYSLMPPQARVIGPSPCYAAHCSAEAAHSDDHHPTYRLDPHRSWAIDLDDLRAKVKYNDSIAGVLVINPDNPTSAVHSAESLREVVKIAREFDLFLIFDEIYCNIVYGDVKTARLAEIVGDVCGISMRGISKEYPWPGSRCGWIEILNRGRDQFFDAYVTALLAAKRLEVCSTTMPQMTIPRIMGDSRYPAHLAARAAMFKARAGGVRGAVGHFRRERQLSRRGVLSHRHVRARRAEQPPVAQDRQGAGPRAGGRACPNRGQRRALRVLPAGRHRNLRRAAERLWLLAGRFPGHTTGMRRRQTRLDAKDAGNGDERVPGDVSCSRTLEVRAARHNETSPCGVRRFRRRLHPSARERRPLRRNCGDLSPRACSQTRGTPGYLQTPADGLRAEIWIGF